MLDWIKGRNTKNRKDLTKYNFHLKSQPQQIDSSSTINLTAYTNAFQNATIPCVFRWSVIRNNLKIQRNEFKGSSFKCEPSDLGALIQAEVISTDQQYEGTAIVQFGPIAVNMKLRSQVQKALASGCLSVTAHIVQGIQQRECQIRLLQNIVKINHVYSQANLTFDYSIYEPKLQCIAKDSARIVISFTEKYHNQLIKLKNQLFAYPIKNLNEMKKQTPQQIFQSQNSRNMEIKFANHSSRDLFIFVWKSLATKKQLETPIMVNQPQIMNQKVSHSLDYLMDIESLKRELMRMDQKLQASERQKTQYIEEIGQLKEKIQSTIKSYTSIIREKFQNLQYNDENSIFQVRQAQKNKYKDLQNDNNHLNSRINALTKEIDTIRFQPLQLLSARRTSNIQPITNSSHIHEQRKHSKSINDSPFSKKKTTDQSQDFVNLLNDFSQSRISYVSQIPTIEENPEIYDLLSNKQKENLQLQRKLDKSFQQIANLENQLRCAKNALYVKNQKMSQSAINFSYNNTNNSVQNLSETNQNKIFNSEVQKMNLLKEIKELKRENQQLMKIKIQQNKIQDKFKKVDSISMKQRSFSISQSVQEMKSLSEYDKTEKRIPIFSDQQKELENMIQIKQKQICSLRTQNIHLLQQNSRLSHQIQTLQRATPQCEILQKKIQQLQLQIEIYRRNLDAMNRSQQLSMEVDSTNDDQVSLLKRQNQFLSNENIKLSRACEKYMNEAKQSNKLRSEIISLRQKIAKQNIY